MSPISIIPLLTLCVAHNATNLDISTGDKPALRKRGELIRVDDIPLLSAADTIRMMEEVTTERTREEYKNSDSADFAFQHSDGTRFRGAVYKERGNCTLSLRRIPDQILTADEIGLPPAAVNFCNAGGGGLVLVTGKTGEGKTTTLATLIDHINVNQRKKIITFEDPIEYSHHNKRSMVNQREIGSDVPSFSEALRRALRQNPDVIMVGEMRDLITIATAVSAAETGHLVFATLHALGASSAVTRVIDVFPADEKEHVRAQLAASLLGVISQVLCPRSDVPGMVAAYEVMVAIPAIQNQIRENRTHQIDSTMQLNGKDHGMQLLDAHLLHLFTHGHISAETAIKKSRDSRTMSENVRKVS